jgi:hypothetical protein
MKIIQKTLKGLDDCAYYTKHLHIINQFFNVPLSNKELEVLATFMSIKGDIIKKDRFGTTARKIVMEQTNISLGGLGNYLKILTKKGFIFKNDYGVFEIVQMVIPDDNVQGYQFKISKVNEDN